MAQVVSRQSLTADAPVGTWLNPSDVGGGRSGPGKGFGPSATVFLVVKLYQCPTLIFIYM